MGSRLSGAVTKAADDENGRRTTQHVELFASPAFGACIGYCANRLAVKMIFRPTRGWHVLGVRVPMTPGLFVRRRKAFAQAFACELVARFLGPRDIVRALGQAVDAGLGDHVRKRLPPAIASMAMKRLNSLTPAEVSAFAADASKFLCDSGVVSRVVSENLDGMSPIEIECMVHKVAGRELRAMAYFDATLGALVGLIQALVMIAVS